MEDIPAAVMSRRRIMNPPDAEEGAKRAGPPSAFWLKRATLTSGAKQDGGTTSDRLAVLSYM